MTINQNHRPLILFLSTLFAWTIASCVQGHELLDNRATLILREDRHVTVTLYVNLPELLHKAVSPDRSFAEFVLVYSAMDPARFKGVIDEAEGRIAHGIAITDRTGAKPPVEKWSWPKASDTQAEIQNLAAQLLTAPKQPPHDDPVEIHGDLIMARKTDWIKAKFPKELGRMLIVFYRPNQIWIDKGQGSIDIRF